MNFVFYHGKSEAFRHRLIDQAEEFWGDPRQVQSDSFCLLAQNRPRDLTVHRQGSTCLCLAGYIGNDAHATAPYAAFAPLLLDGSWPLPEDWFGSFSCVVLDEAARKVVLANDVVGYYPLYYCALDSGEFLAGSSLIVLNSIAGRTPDCVGLLQAISGPDFNPSHGRRTVLRGVRKLLPGEWISFSADGGSPQYRYDNTLFSDLKTPAIEDAAAEIFALIEKHVDYLCKPDSTSYLGLSGGWDSRLLLGAASDKRLHCVTYGQESFYETQVAKRCADACGAAFSCFPYEDAFFPQRDVFSKYVRSTEAVCMPQWIPVLEGINSNGDFPLFMLGVSCEAIDGRSIKKYSTRAGRRRSFWRGLAGIGPTFVPLNSGDVKRWEDGVIEAIVGRQMKRLPLLNKDLLDGSPAEIEDRLREDVLLTTKRVRDGAPFYVELLDELFSWYTHSRIAMGTQMRLLCAQFASISPEMSFQILRVVSNVHPKLRLRRRLMNAIAALDAFRDLAKIPSAQIPFLSMKAPNILKEMVWAVRSGTDQILIRRMMRKKNCRVRSRVLKSFDLASAYRQAAKSGVVESWFSGDWFDPRPFLTLVSDRARLVEWPLVNYDVVGPASASMLLDRAVKSN